jgi:hypothetical protein
MGLILDRVVRTQRLTVDSGNSEKESYQDHAPLQSVAINIQPASPEDTIVVDGVFGQTYIGYTTESGVLSGDKLIDDTLSEAFLVKGKENWMTPALAPHVELTLVKTETQE